MLGNSITGGVWASRADNTFLAQFQKKLKQKGYSNLMSIPKFPGGRGGGWGNVILHWEQVCKEAYPDIILLQGAIEQDGNNTVTSLSSTISATDTTLSFNATPMANQLYLLYDTEKNVKEWVMVNRTDGQRSWRGLFGTNPRVWLAGTKVLANPNASLFTNPKMLWKDAHASRARLDAVTKHILNATIGYKPIVLICDVWFDIDLTWTEGIRNYVSELRSSGVLNVAFVEYVKPDGTRIFADREAIGPSANITSVDTGAGTPPQLTFTCNNELGVKQLTAGEYVAVHDTSLGNFFHNTIEIMRITSINYNNNTFVVSTTHRAQLGSTAINTFGNGDIVCKHSPVGVELRLNFDTLGTSGGYQDCWARDSHPNDYGYSLLADAAIKAFDQVVS